MIEVSHISKSFRVDGMTIVQAIHDVSLTVDQGAFITLIGPSGCGKSTLLNLICGLMEPDTGTIVLEGDPSAKRLGRVGYMLQRDLLLPWRTLLGNLLLGPEVSGQPLERARAQARELLPLFGLDGFEDAYPSALSVGMRQRAALLRTVLCQQELILLDEPFGALDALTRRTMRSWLLEVWSRLNHTIIFVTHDIDEAIYLADEVHVMSPRPGTIVQTTRIELPRPRREEMVNDRLFGEYRTTLLQALGV
ncbi:MAG: ABC transporter ATP-binding protein [Chloroflexi bacterium]|nr:ABC transporter ATP-binding protein [Chloroflexota bacterium]